MSHLITVLFHDLDLFLLRPRPLWLCAVVMQRVGHLCDNVAQKVEGVRLEDCLFPDCQPCTRLKEISIVALTWLGTTADIWTMKAGK